MNDYKRQAFFELKQGNYERYHYFIKMNRIARKKKNDTTKYPIWKKVTKKFNVSEKVVRVIGNRLVRSRRNLQKEKNVIDG